MKTIRFFSVIAIVFSLVLLFSSKALAADARTNVVYEDKGTGTLRVFPYLSPDKKWLFLDFSSANLKNVEYIYYNVNYNTKDSAQKGGYEGKQWPDSKNFKVYKGIPYIRTSTLLGSCSKNICKYNKDPHSFRVTVTYKMKGAKTELTKVVNF